MKSSILFLLFLASGIYANAQQTDKKVEDSATPAIAIPATFNFTIRGFGSSSGRDPLIMVNDVVKTRDEIKDINANDIQSVKVLKDSSATALYGETGRYGVILISLKNRSKLFQENK